MFQETFGDTFQLAYLLLVDYYGWVLYVGAFIWIGYKTWLEYKIIRFLSTIKWTFLEVKVDELNEKSPAAMEQVFTSLHAMFQAFSLGERWTGRIPLHMSAEMVSLGGRVSYIFKVPDRFRNLLESAVFAQYPKAEIREIQDYLANLPRTYDKQTSEFELWGTQMIKRADNALPIRTFRDVTSYFEHPEQKTTIEPLSGVLEALSNIMPHELMSIQIVIQPMNEEWKKAGVELIAKMKGIPPKAKAAGWFDVIFLHIPGAILDGILQAISGTEAVVKKEEKAQPLTQTMTDSEKHNIDAVVAGLSKHSFKTKIRILYLAPKDKISMGTRIPEILGAIRNFDNPQLNGLRPDVARINTQVSFKLFQRLEQPWLDHKMFTRKNKFLRWFKDRGIQEGSATTILNTEELATLFHFPQSPNARISQIERVTTVKSAPPIDLPIG